jgi:hypothetical protein
MSVADGARPLVERTTASSGLAIPVTDEAVLARVAAILRAAAPQTSTSTARNRRRAA